MKLASLRFTAASHLLRAPNKQVRDIWARKDLGLFEKTFTVNVAALDAPFLIISDEAVAHEKLVRLHEARPLSPTHAHAEMKDRP